MDEWNIFVKTGRVEDYIKYVEAKERKKEQVRSSDGNKDRRTGDKGDLYG